MVPEILSATDIFLCHFGLFSALPHAPRNNPEYQNFEKTKKTPGDIIILHMCTINYNHVMYVFRDVERNGQNFFVILEHFLLFTPLAVRKMKISKK